MVHLLLVIIYISFISLGLPDSLLGAAWPSMYPTLGVPVSYAGAISMIIALGTVVSSLQSDRLTRKIGTGKVTACSVAMTAAALAGFSFSHSFAALCLWAVPYGLGAGSVDASLNNYVALHYESRHMSWLHCMWGLGAAAGPYIMGWALTGGLGWHAGYRVISLMQAVLTAVLLVSLPLWKGRTEGLSAELQAAKRQAAGQQSDERKTARCQTEGQKSSGVQNAEQKPVDGKPLSLPEIVRIPGVKEVMISFFCYCAIEQTSGLWASSYLTLYKGVPAETAAGFASMFFIGITAGRAVSGFLTIRLNDAQMVRLGEALIALGVLVMLLSPGRGASLAGLIIIGLGCAPVYPCLIHSTPAHFGADRSQAIIGVQMASAYVGTCLMPPVFGLIAGRISIALLPVYLFLILILLAVMHERLIRTA